MSKFLGSNTNTRSLAQESTLEEVNSELGGSLTISGTVDVDNLAQNTGIIDSDTLRITLANEHLDIDDNLNVNVNNQTELLYEPFYYAVDARPANWNLYSGAAPDKEIYGTEYSNLQCSNRSWLKLYYTIPFPFTKNKIYVLQFGARFTANAGSTKEAYVGIADNMSNGSGNETDSFYLGCRYRNSEIRYTINSVTTQLTDLQDPLELNGSGFSRGVFDDIAQSSQVWNNFRIIYYNYDFPKIEYWDLDLNGDWSKIHTINLNNNQILPTVQEPQYYINIICDDNGEGNDPWKSQIFLKNLQLTEYDRASDIEQLPTTLSTNYVKKTGDYINDPYDDKIVIMGAVEENAGTDVNYQPLRVDLDNNLNCTNDSIYVDGNAFNAGSDKITVMGAVDEKQADVYALEFIEGGKLLKTNTNLDTVSLNTILVNNGNSGDGCQRICVAPDYDLVRDRIYISEFLKEGVNISLAANLVNGTVYKFTSPVGYTSYITRMLITIRDDGTLVPDKFGTINALTNGFEIYYKTTSGGSKIYLGATNDRPIKNNGDIDAICFDANLHETSGAGGDELEVFRYTFSKSGTPLKLLDTGLIAWESLGDDVSGVSDAVVMIQGYRVLD